MKFVIKHEIRGRIRFHVAQKNMSDAAEECGDAESICPDDAR